jgi:guanylate kinase
MHPRVFVISGPSGTGKSTIIHGAMEQVPELRLSVSYTTRSPRPGEVEGQDYYFTDRDSFERRIEAGEFLEWARVFDNYYGTSAREVARILAEEQHALLDVDVQGAKSIKSTAHGATYIFVMPPSMEVLAERLRNRGTETEESLQKRLGKAEFEASHAHMYDHTIVNDDVERAVGEMVDVIRSEAAMATQFLHKPAPRGGTPAAGEALVKKLSGNMRVGLREEMIELINSRVRSTLYRDLDRLILEAFRDYNRRDS